MPPLSDVDLWSETEDCTAAKTTFANDTPDAAPRCLGLAAPGIPENPVLVTNFCNLLASSPFPSPLSALLVADSVISEMVEPGPSMGDLADPPLLEQYSRFSAGGKAMLFDDKSASSCSTLVSR